LPGDLVGARLGVTGDLARGLHLVEPGRHLVETGEAEIGHGGGHDDGARPHRRQHVLAGVERLRHRLEVDDAGGALQRVKRAEGTVEALLVAGILLEGQ